ncbi:hypothetical protein Tco_1126393 [Tanacetum coccineum]
MAEAANHISYFGEVMRSVSYTLRLVDCERHHHGVVSSEDSTLSRESSSVRALISEYTHRASSFSEQAHQRANTFHAEVLRTDRLIGGFADGSSTSGSADGSLGSGPKPTQDWALPWPIIDSSVGSPKKPSMNSDGTV